MKTRSVFEPTEKNPKGEIHEDFGVFSYDRTRKTFVMRGFYVAFPGKEFSCYFIHNLKKQK